MLNGVQIFFENEFIEAQRVFASQDQVNPIYALGSGALAFMKGNTEPLIGQTCHLALSVTSYFYIPNDNH